MIHDDLNDGKEGKLSVTWNFSTSLLNFRKKKMGIKIEISNFSYTFQDISKVANSRYNRFVQFPSLNIN